MGNYCTHPMQYKCIQFKINLDILDDQFLELTIDDILNCKEYASIYEPIYGRWKSDYAIYNPIQYRWVPIKSHVQSYILVYFYYLSNNDSNINVESIRCCFKKRFHHLVHPTFIEINIGCPANIPITQLCMRCHERKCDSFRYGLHDNAVHISLTHHHCSECKQLNNTRSSLGISSGSDNIRVHNIININTSTDNHCISTEPAYDVHKVSFQFQLFMHQAVMKHINPSVKIGYEVQLVMKEIEKHIREAASDRKGLINCYCNQLKREHKERIWAIKNNERVNDQMHHFNFEDDPIVMNTIINLIEDGKVSPDEWMKSIKELKLSFFDPNNIMEKLVENKYPFIKGCIKLNRKKFFKNLNCIGNWDRAIKAVQKRDCESSWCQKQSKSFADTSENKLCTLLDDNGYEYRTESELQKDRYYDNNDGTPDVLFQLDKPLVLQINGETKIIYWIDFKNWCCWVTTKMRYKLWQQNHRYLYMHSNKQKKVVYGFMRHCMNTNNKPTGIIKEIVRICHLYYALPRATPGMFVFGLGYVENINISNAVTIVSLLWLQNNITPIKKTSTKARIITIRSKSVSTTTYKWYNNLDHHHHHVIQMYTLGNYQRLFTYTKIHTLTDKRTSGNLTLEIKESDEWLCEEEEDYCNYCTNLLKLLPAAYRDEHGAMYPLNAKDM